MNVATISVDRPDVEEPYRVWTERVVALHPGTVPIRNERLFLTPLSRPLRQCRVALLSTAGVHRLDQEPFDWRNEMGDPGYRFIPDGTPSGELTVHHGHYDQRAAESDINCLFPIERLHELVEAEVVGAAGPTHVGMMGYLPDPGDWLRETVPAVVARLVKDGNDAVFISPG